MELGVDMPGKPAEIRRMGRMLVDAGKLTDEQLLTAVAEQKRVGGMLGDVVVTLGYVTPEDVALALSEQLHVPYYELGEDFKLDREESHLLPESVARRFCVIPLKRKSRALTVTLVMKDPLDFEAAEAVRTLTNMEVRKAVSTPARIMSVIDRFYKEEAHIERTLRDIVDLESDGGAATIETIEEQSADADQLRVLANDAPVVKFVNLILMEAVRDRASDIHFEPSETTVSVRFRIDGVLSDVTPPPRHLYQAIVTRIKILSNMDIAERRLPLDGRFKFKAGGRRIDVRVSSLPEVFGEKMVLRILDRGSMVADMRDIGFEQDMLNEFQRVLQMPHGIILLTGPTGSGKTTTLYAALNALKSRETNIQTVEDPVEYLLEGVNQMQVRAQIGLDFAAGLRAILRQDPDIILIGEIRDLETAQIAIRASLTGHLVLSTLHTNDSPTAFCRLTDIGVPPYMAASTVRLVLSQRLVRVLCPRCKRACAPTLEGLRMTVSQWPDAEGWTYYETGGCPDCNNIGYRGRKAIAEFLPVSEAVRQMILAKEGEMHFRARAIELGMEPLLKNGLRKVQRGETTVEEVLSVCPIEGF